jgi:hypothetical protein
MRKLYQSEKYLRYAKKRAKKSLRRRLKRKRIIRAQRRAAIGKSRYTNERQLDRIRFRAKISAPENFSLIQNPEETISFINELGAALRERKSTFVILQKIKFIDYSAITLLLSIMFRFKEEGIKFNGDFPNNQEAKRLLVDSDFFEHLKSAAAKTPKYVIRKQNQILTTSRDVDPSICSPILKEATRTIWGKIKLINGKGLYRVLIELMHNTHNHAAEIEGKRHWWLSINQDEENSRVRFVFMDNGVGVFSSLNNKPIESKWYGWQEKLKKVFGSQTNEQILKLLLEGRVHEIAIGKSTATGNNFRGKGLPGVNGVLERSQISNLYIITNNVYANVSKREYTLLSNSFSGTFYYWELCKKNDSTLWEI